MILFSGDRLLMPGSETTTLAAELLGLHGRAGIMQAGQFVEREPG